MVIYLQRYLQQYTITQRLLVCRLYLFMLIYILFSLLLSNVAQASSSVEKQSIACQQAQTKMQVHLQKANAIRDNVVVFTQLDNLSRTELDIAYLQIERELLSLAKNSQLQYCDFSELSSEGLEQLASDDGKFRLYRWATDFEVPHSTGYATVMYAQPKQTNFYPADYINRKRYAEVGSQVITIAQPISKPVSKPTSKLIPEPKHATDNEADFPLYGLVERNFSRGQYRIHCEPTLSLFRVKQNERLAYIDDITFKFLDANGKEIDTQNLFSNGCDGDQRTKDYIADNQFHYDSKTRVLTFRMSVMTDFDEETLSGYYAFKHYRFRFNGKDFVQLKQFY